MNSRKNCCWLACVAALLELPACSRARNTPPDTSSLTCQAPPPRTRETFASEMQTAMLRMHEAMDVTYSGDPDHDFARMMIPHHQGALDMAVAELRFGQHEQLRRLAAGMIVEQRSEIALMQHILAETRSSLLSEGRITRQLGPWK